MNDKDPSLELARIKYASFVAIFGLGLSAVLVVVLVFGARMRAAADIVAIVGVFTGVTGTLVGAFFGLQIGSAGREKERAERREAEGMKSAAFAMMNEDQVNHAMEMYNKEFKTDV